MRRAAPVGMTDLGCLAHMVAKIIDDPSFRQGPARCRSAAHEAENLRM